ncbi:hypothetical protein M8J76_003290 [Diaphorina citri]|nr:hypothetical protein M8J76_003290 [Diaphorina citri]
MYCCCSDNENSGGATHKTSDSHSSTSSNSAGAHSSSGGSQECQLYVPPPQTLRLHCVQPFTLVFSVQDYGDLTVMDVIDILDEQLSPDVRSGLKGARIIEEQCYLSFSNQDQVNTVLDQGIRINDAHIQLEDASIGTAVIALTGVPHDVDDPLVANILSSFGTILGSIERRMYKGVDTGERLIRLRPRGHIPSFIFIMGQRVTLRVIDQDEISCLRLKRRRSFRSQINLNIKLLDNDDIIIEPIVQGSECHTMPSLKRQQRQDPVYHSMPRIARQSPSPAGPSGYIPVSAPNSPPRPRDYPDNEPEYANILPTGAGVGDYDVPRSHTCRTIEVNPAQPVGTSEHIEINVARKSDQPESDTQTPKVETPSKVQTPSKTETPSMVEAPSKGTSNNGKTSSSSVPHSTDAAKDRRPSLRLQMFKNITTGNEPSSTTSGTPMTSQTIEKSVFDFNRKSSIKFDRSAQNGSVKSSKIVHSPKISRKLSIYNPPDTPGKTEAKPSTPQTSGNETSSPGNSKKSPKRISKKSIKNIDGKPSAECSQSSSEGQESPTKHRKLLSMKGKKPVTRQASGDQEPTSLGEMTTCSERERSYSDSSSILVTSRKMSTTGREGTGKVPWCGCWGNGCL